MTDLFMAGCINRSYKPPCLHSPSLFSIYTYFNTNRLEFDTAQNYHRWWYENRSFVAARLHNMSWHGVLSGHACLPNPIPYSKFRVFMKTPARQAVYAGICTVLKFGRGLAFYSKKHVSYSEVKFHIMGVSKFQYSSHLSIHSFKKGRKMLMLLLVSRWEKVFACLKIFNIHKANFFLIVIDC